MGLGKPLEHPKVDVQSVSVDDASYTGIDGRIGLDVMNPNAVGLPLRGMDWEIAIGGARAVTGRTELALTIPAMGSAPVETMIHISTADAAEVSMRLAQGERGYQVRGVLHFSTSLGTISVPFTHEGTL